MIILHLCPIILNAMFFTATCRQLLHVAVRELAGGCALSPYRHIYSSKVATECLGEHQQR